MPADFHDKVHEDISTQLGTLSGLVLAMTDRIARLEVRVALFSALGGGAAGLIASILHR